MIILTFTTRGVVLLVTVVSVALQCIMHMYPFFTEVVLFTAPISSYLRFYGAIILLTILAIMERSIMSTLLEDSDQVSSVTN